MRDISKELGLPFRKSGCASLDLAYVAAGRYDGYFQHGLNIWDLAAGIILVKEAGGMTNEINLSNNANLNVIASSESISAKLNEKLVGKVKVLKKTKTLVFISSEIFASEKIVATASGTWKIL